MHGIIPILRMGELYCINTRKKRKIVTSGFFSYILQFFCKNVFLKREVIF